MDLTEANRLQSAHPFLFLSRGGLMCNLYGGRDAILWRVCMVGATGMAISREPLSDEEVVVGVLAGETAM